MIIYLIGNEQYPSDNLPHRLKRFLMRQLPDAEFVPEDPTGDFIPQKGSVIIDTVTGIRKPAIWSSLSDFKASPRVSVHDYDLFLHLSMLIKLGKIESIFFVGIPEGSPVNDQFAGQIADLIRSRPAELKKM